MLHIHLGGSAGTPLSHRQPHDCPACIQQLPHILIKRCHLRRKENQNSIVLGALRPEKGIKTKKRHILEVYVASKRRGNFSPARSCPGWVLVFNPSLCHPQPCHAASNRRHAGLPQGSQYLKTGRICDSIQTLWKYIRLAAGTSLLAPQERVYSEQEPSSRKQKGNTLTDALGQMNLVGTEQISLELQVI